MKKLIESSLVVVSCSTVDFTDNSSKVTSRETAKVEEFVSQIVESWFSAPDVTSEITCVAVTNRESNANKFQRQFYLRHCQKASDHGRRSVGTSVVKDFTCALANPCPRRSTYLRVSSRGDF